MIRTSTWNKKSLQLRLEGVKYRRITAESIAALPTYRTRKVMWLKSQTLMELDSINYTKILKVLLERYIVKLKVIYKYWTDGPVYDTYQGRNGEIIEAKPILTGKPMETLELMKQQSTLFYMVLPNFLTFTQYEDALDLTQNISNIVCGRLNIDKSRFKTSKSKQMNSKTTLSVDDQIYALQLENIYKEINGDDLDEMDLALKCMEYVLRKCIDDKPIADSYNSLVTLQHYFRDYIYYNILDIDEYNRITRGIPKPKSEEEELRERYYIENN